MTEQYLAEALQEVSDEHIMEATLPLRKKKKKAHHLWGFAACFAVLAVCSFFVIPFFAMGGGMAESEGAAEGGASEDYYNSESESFGQTDGSQHEQESLTGDALDWGVTLTAQDVTPTGLTIVCTQSGGFEGELITGSWYSVEKYSDGEWTELPYLMDNVGWTEEGWIISPDTTVEWVVDWEWLYGELPAGRYRIGKDLLGASVPGEYEHCIHYAEFTIG